MAELSQLTPGTLVTGLSPDGVAKVLHVEWHGADTITLTFRDETTGRTESRPLYRWNESELEIVEASRAWTFEGDPALLRLAAEAYRIHLAHLFDPMIAMHASLVEPLPHQISAVYEEMLPRQPLRFLLADDPGAGKTIMAGLLIKELMLRGSVERCLICVPANLAEQWQDELRDKFGLEFNIVGRPSIEASVTNNPFGEHPRVISRIDLMKQDENIERLRNADEWDLIIVDEAHKMSASLFGNEVKMTARYRLGQALSERSENLVLLTATPHRGKADDFQLFLALLDPDRFEGQHHKPGQAVDAGDLMRRLLKEELTDFDGKPLFPERLAYTVRYELSPEERELYDAVTKYVQEEMNRADALVSDTGEGQKRRNVVGFALTTLQRRLASSANAIHRSLERRRKKLEEKLEAIRKGKSATETLGELPRGIAAELEDLEDDLEENPENEVEQIVDLATAARTVAELEAEIASLKQLEARARALVRSDQSRKLDELKKLLFDRPEMYDRNGTRRKLVVFTEHRDTLDYLELKIGNLLGRKEAVVSIHGGLGREERREAQYRFLNDPETFVLVATDAAGEGVNLQRAHLMVNYDLPWNPNRLEQRFGRIHRFGQREVCHLWNLVAHETREGFVWWTLFEKLSAEREALGGKVYDVLGEMLEGSSLRELLMDAVRYGDSPEARARLETRIDEKMNPDRFREVIEEYALDASIFGSERLRTVRDSMERAEARRLVPHLIASFFQEAFRLLGGRATEREPGRYQVSYVPAEIRRRAGLVGRGIPVTERYERIVFDKALVHVDGKPSPAAFVAPGHPLLDAVVDLIVERYGDLLRAGAVLVDPSLDAVEPRVLFFIEHTVTDQRLEGGQPRVVSREVAFVEIDRHNNAAGAGAAPYLDYRPATEGQRERVPADVLEAFAGQKAEKLALDHAVQHLVPEHFARVRDEREALIVKTMAAVKERLTREVFYWETRAEELKEAELAGKQKKLNSARAFLNAERLRARLKERMADLERAKQMNPGLPRIVGGALVIPERMLVPTPGPPPDPEALRRSEALAMAAVFDRERALGNEPKDVSKELGRGYDIESRDGQTGHLRMIEVKGVSPDREHVVLTKSEYLAALNRRENFILAVAVNDGDRVLDLQYHAPDLTAELPFDLTSVLVPLKQLAGDGGVGVP